MNKPTLSEIMAATLLSKTGKLSEAFLRTADGKAYLVHDSIQIARGPVSDVLHIKFCFAGEEVWAFDPISLARDASLTIKGVTGRMEVGVS